MNNEDFITIRKIDKHSDVQSDKVIVSIMDLTAMQSNITNTPPPSMQRQQHTINISKDYIEKDILKEFIDKVVEICEPETYNERVFEHKTKNKITTDIDKRRLMSRMISCGSYIATNGRIGPAHFVLVPYYYYEKLSDLIDERGIGSMQIYPTNLLTDKMIFGRKPDDSQAGIFLFLDEKRHKYDLVEIGTAKHQYHILKITCLQFERRKKLMQIENVDKNS